MQHVSPVGASIVVPCICIIIAFIRAYYFVNMLTFAIHKTKILLFWWGLQSVIEVTILFCRLEVEWVATAAEMLIDVILLCCLPKDRWRYRFGVLILWNVIIIISDVIAVSFMLAFGKGMGDVSQSIHILVISGIILAMVHAAVVLCVLALLKRIKSGVHISFHSVILFVAFPLIQVLIVMDKYLLVKYLGEYFDLLILLWVDDTIVMIAHFALADLLLYFAIKDLRKKKRLKEEYEFLQRQRQEEYAHMQAMIAGEDERRKFYHDINNNLSVIQTLIADGHCYEAQNIMDSVCEKIKNL